MSGHSKWANIKHKKAKEDDKRGRVFTRISKEILVAAREGGGDPAGNVRLRILIEKGRAVNMPKDNIDRAIKKGIGELGGEHYESVSYEGYGPCGVAVIVEVLTENKNRTISDVRHCFSKRGGAIGADGSVAWMFHHKGVVTFAAPGASEDDLLEKFLDLDIDELILDDGMVTLECAMDQLDTVRSGAEKLGFKVESAELAWIPRTPAQLNEDQEKIVYDFLDAVSDVEDVQNVYANIE